MNKRRKHQPSDIKIYYNIDKYDEIERLWKRLDPQDRFVNLLLLLALFGVESDVKRSVNEKDGKEKEHNFSRVVYQNNQVTMDSMIGLITILDNIDKKPEKIINEVAFAKMYNLNVPFAKLPNINSFYSSVVSGIEPLYELLTGLGNDLQDIATQLYDEVTTDEDEIINYINQLILEDEFDDNV